MKPSTLLQPIATAGVLAALLLSSACAPTKTSDTMAPSPTYSTDEAVGDGLTIKFNPRVDILFLIDNSMSMKNKQEKLKAASALFVDKLGGNSVIDYRVGAITVFDKTHCGDSCYPAGKLRAPFVSRTGDVAKDKEAMLNVLNVGVQDLKDGGPEFEELFHPIAVATSPEMNKINGGFIRPDSHVVIVMVTDESDSSNDYSVDDFLGALSKNIGLGRLDLYAIVTKSASDRGNGQKDRAPVRIQQALEAAEGVEMAKAKTFDITDKDFGTHLGAIVTDIKKRIAPQQMHLKSEPESGTIKVYYLADGEKPSKENEVKEGWSYNSNPENPTITIHENVKVDYAPNKYFKAEYIQIAEFSRRKGKVSPVKH